MKQAFNLILLAFIVTFPLFSQIPFEYQKHDYIWLTGYSSNPDFPIVGGTIIDFNETPVSVEYEFREMDFNVTNASICDEDGNLLFYTNGEYIANSEGELMENGDSLNYTTSLDGYRLPQGAIILPKPDSDSLYYVFHENREYFEDGTSVTIVSRQLFYSLINIKSNNGLGTIIEKNVSLVQDTLDTGKITATRHANGRDWWVVIFEYNQPGYYLFLITPQGIEPHVNQAVEGAESFNSGLGQAVFSPDGTKFARLSLYDLYDNHYIDIYEFDRCSGEFYNPIQITYIDTAYSGGVAISPNNRYLYVSSYKYVYQYDLQASDIESSKEVIAVLDGFQSPFYTTFFLAQLAPDNKIYINSNNSVDYMHVIHNPNAAAAACQLEQHSLQLPTLNAFSMPNNPYFRLGPHDGSLCDTLGLDNHPKADFYHIVNDTLVSFWDYSLFVPSEWTWDFGDNTEMSYEQNPQHKYTQSGIYEVCLTATNYAGSDTFCDTLFINVVATQDPESPVKNLKLYPNPVSDVFYISYLSNEEGYAILYDSYGREVKRRPLKKGNILQAWNACELVSGVYFLKGVVKGKNVFIRKIIKH